MDRVPPPARSATALGVTVRRRRRAVLGARLCLPRGTASMSACRRWSSRCIAYVWPGLALLPFVAAGGFGNLGGIGWRRGFALALFGGLPLALLSYIGYSLCSARPWRRHSAVMRGARRPAAGAAGACREPLPARRIAGALAMVVGLARHRRRSAARPWARTDSAATSCSWRPAASLPIFGMLLRLWRIPRDRGRPQSPACCRWPGCRSCYLPPRQCAGGRLL